MKDVVAELDFIVVRKAQRKEEREGKGRKKGKIEAELVGPSMIDDNDERWQFLKKKTMKGGWTSFSLVMMVVMVRIRELTRVVLSSLCFI
jgi:hypothetical protein